MTQKKRIFRGSEFKELMNDDVMRERFFFQGLAALMMLLDGREVWDTLPIHSMTLEQARETKEELGEVTAEDAQRVASSYADSVAFYAHHALHELLDEFNDWAKENGRGDLLAHTLDVVNASLPADERIGRSDT